MKKEIGIVTVTTGYNYGTSLQALASKINLIKMGYSPRILGYKGSVIKGRDIRLKKILITFLRLLFYPKLFLRTFETYKNSLNKKNTKESKKKFNVFTEEYLNIEKMTKNEMKKYGKKEEVLALVCGSDQIWSSTLMYIDPFYYLQYFPKEKRVAYAPSFGKSEVPEYNKKIIKRYLLDFCYLSTREIEGKKIIKELTGKEAKILIDPTLLLSKEEWKETMKLVINKKQEYILFYFLDTPSLEALKVLKEIVKRYKIKIINIPHIDNEIKKICKNIETLDAGPKEFLELILNARLICTDSYHGMLFSINFNKDFYVFERNYGSAHNQSSRITSILKILKLEERYIKIERKVKKDSEINWKKVNEELEEQRKKSKDYLIEAFEGIEGKNEK